MKSRNLKAIFATLSAVAVMATAMTGFAAATTTYDTLNKKVSVKETVTADPNKEVTYLVKSDNEIVYIDQATADSAGSVTFEYKIAAEKLAAGLKTEATFGTDGVKSITDGSSTLDLYDYSVDPVFDNCTVTYGQDIAGNGDEVNVTIEPVSGYEIVSYTINDGSPIDYVKAITVKKGEQITAVTTKKAYVAPTINAQETEVGPMVDDASLGETYKAITTVISYTGDFTDGAIGVLCGDYYYPAKVAKGGKAAVKLILPEGSENVDVKAYANTNN